MTLSIRFSPTLTMTMFAIDVADVDVFQNARGVDSLPIEP